ncbi:MAG: putative aminophospholipid-translocase [Thelocarpon superellum]|nr:MAG: putative aminophospholipid-translocase [Thelocarpon superellum]
MSRSQRSHRPLAPAGVSDDSDSDLELDLQELDPTTTTTASPWTTTRNPGRGSRRTAGNDDRHGQIALRHLRLAGRGRSSGQSDRHNGRRPRAAGGPTDMNGDNEIDGQPRNSDLGLQSGDDEAPLLQGSSSIRRRDASREAGRMTRWIAHLPLPTFLRSSSTWRDGGSPDDHNEGTAPEHGASRTVGIGQVQSTRYPANAVSNAKYNAWNFLPLTLYNEFSFFFNLYFLLVALSQIIPALRIGYLTTYIAPLAFVLSITLGKEALDDISRRRRDAEANAEPYHVLRFDPLPPPSPGSQGPKGDQQNGSTLGPTDAPEPVSSRVRPAIVRSRDLKVGDVLRMGKDQRVPADVVILQSHPIESSVLPVDLASDPTLARHENGNDAHNAAEVDAEAGGVGETFIRTDQLDGETDWKLRLASPLTQSRQVGNLTRLRVLAAKPDRKVNEFVGTVELLHAGDPTAPAIQTSPLTIDNTAWANTVLASNATILAVVIYTGPQTRQALSTSPSRSKTGLLEYEINALSKILCVFTLALSVILVALEGFESTEERKWYVAIMLYLILFSTIIPISLRVNLDMGKTVYAWFIERDRGIQGTVVRTSTIPEDLGRIEYLLSDKTGTLTQNEMELKKIHVGTVSYANEAMDEVAAFVRHAFGPSGNAAADRSPALMTPTSVFPAPVAAASTSTATRTRREIGSRVRDIVLALALCHNVTPTAEKDGGTTVTDYQASSPDEIAIVRWTESVGLRLLHRDRTRMTLQSTDSEQVVVRVRILDVFPFTSEGKRMGMLAQFLDGLEDAAAPAPTGAGLDGAGDIWFFQKGADTVMSDIVAANDWLDEETANMAREGLRTLVVGRKKVARARYEEFSAAYQQASVALHGRDASMARVVQQYLECDLELLGVTGVEDKLQRDVKPSLELLRNAGIKIWMLTGDKVETARCVAVSAKLVARGQYVHTMARLTRPEQARDALDFLRSRTDACLLIDGDSLALCLSHCGGAFIAVAVRLPAVIACRCSPTQKAEVASLIRAHTRKRVCCIGDGGNDVSMIQAADVGVGIVGKEGRQASLAADFSILQFCHLTKLLVWHGRNSYKRSAKLAQFVMHRGLIISVCQTMFSIASRFEPNALYKVGSSPQIAGLRYATVYTMAPVFSLVLDKDVDEDVANLYPELYKELRTGRSLSYRSFLVWVLVSIYQGGMIQGLSQILVEVEGPRMVAVSFTVLIINELMMVAFEITTWHPVMIFSLLGTAAYYVGSVPFLGRYYDLEYVVTIGFVWRVAAIASIALIPPYAAKIIRRTWKPPSYRKVQGL